MVYKIPPPFYYRIVPYRTLLSENSVYCRPREQNYLTLSQIHSKHGGTGEENVREMFSKTAGFSLHLPDRFSYFPKLFIMEEKWPHTVPAFFSASL
jgi:hypothetical protein